MKKTIHSPASIGLEIILDPAEIYPHDPGQGTPVMVQTRDRKFAATWDCATSEGELDCGAYRLNKRQCAWLESKEEEVYAWMKENVYARIKENGV